MSDFDLDDLRNELSEFALPEKKVGRSPREERIVAGFEEIQRFVEDHGRTPKHGEDCDIFERLYAVRLDRLRSQDDCRELLVALDHQGLLSGADAFAAAPVETMDEDELLAELEGLAGDADITQLRHVRPSAEKRAAEEIANREPCDDFDQFKPLFDRVRQDLKVGVRETRKIDNSENSLADIKPGALFIVGGQIAVVVEEEKSFVTEYNRTDRRLRVIYDNKTQSNVLARSLQKALYRDGAARRITELSAGPLFAEVINEEDLASGTIYVLRSKSVHPLVAANREVLHKIGVTGGDVVRRVANAKLDPTFLMAEVEIVATYTLFNINRTKLENLIHRIFDPARLDIEIKDRFGNPVVPREWFLVPLFVIDDAVERIRSGDITGCIYDPKEAKLVDFTRK
ncbi:GIY-YIG nuclease family protein [Sphingorhabdus sp. IMCC26285]|uniref:GIY-YIG nuclease family protein n=1 Tax=Sphingorhabdus profundilacus TaxID=2509718 RepID=A0A6I4LXY7_9SPHN|nr:GIY-YIG nuclease family protein [Sphingorhabdus profundilacus]MVZ97911.1 GIY-YIG nuclease family protein [Sphingorhabdus profundilacus]